MTIEAVVFDIGNVVVRWDVRALYRTIFDDPAEMERFLADVWTPMENDRCDRGTPFAEVIAEMVARHPDDELAIRAAWDRWIETIPGPVEGMLELIDELAEAGIPLFALSNFSAETFPLVQRRYPHFERFDRILISGEHSPLAKPDAAFFRLLCEQTGFVPEQMVFIDDAAANVSAAAALGFTAVLFTDTTTLRRELDSLGVLSDDRTP
jgi:2-haloacid dehalogenase